MSAWIAGITNHRRQWVITLFLITAVVSVSFSLTYPPSSSLQFTEKEVRKQAHFYDIAMFLDANKMDYGRIWDAKVIGNFVFWLLWAVVGGIVVIARRRKVEPA